MGFRRLQQVGGQANRIYMFVRQVALSAGILIDNRNLGLHKPTDEVSLRALPQGKRQMQISENADVLALHMALPSQPKKGDRRWV